MRVRPLVLSPLVLLAGCGGERGVSCEAVYEIDPVPVLAGRYAATFTPEGASAATRTYALTVAADGTVSGTIGMGDAAQAIGRFSRAGDLTNECDTSRMVLSIRADDTIAAGETLEASRKRQGALTGAYSATLASEAAQATGTLVLTAG